MEDNELIERYLRGELSQDEIKSFEQRLESDEEFRNAYEIESVVFKAIAYSVEKERIKSYATLEKVESQAESRLAWLQMLNGNNLFGTAGLAILVWIISSLIFRLSSLDPGFIKWIGFALAVTIPILFGLLSERKISPQPVLVFALNGVIVFVLASGFDAINQGISLKSGVSKAELIPLAKGSAWWPTRSLEDSLETQREIRQKIEKRNHELRTELQSVKDSCFESHFDQVTPIVIPRSRNIVKGGYIEALLIGAVSYTMKNAEVSINGQPATVVIDNSTGVNVGIIKIPTKSDVHDEGFGQRSVEALVKIGERELRQTIEYLVAQPTIKVTTGNAPTLYMNCGNAILMEVPALGLDYHPTFDAGQSAEIIPGEKPGRITVIPRQRKVTIEVINNGASIGTHHLDVKKIPDPTFVAYIGNTPVDLRSGIRANQLPYLRFAAEPDPDFKEEVPRDARYTIKRAQISLGRGSRAVQSLSATSETPDLTSWISDARPGDRVIIDIREVIRKTFTDSEEQVEIRGSSGIIHIPIL